jgi:hypothetical protein
VALAAAAVVLVLALAHYRYYFDDAYITLRYARNFAGGSGPVWNPGEQVEGYTTFLWMALHAGLAKLGADLVIASRVLGFASVMATLVAVYGIWRLWAREAPGSGLASPLVFAGAALALAATDAVSYWGLSGGEQLFFTALLVAGVLAYLTERRNEGALPISAVVFTAAAMTRPEGVLAAGVTGAFVAYDAWCAEDRPAAVRRVLSWWAIFVGFFGAYFIWRWSYYGYVFPNTYYAKVDTTSALLERGADYVWSAVVRYSVLPLLAAGAGLLLIPRLRRDVAYLAAIIGVLLAAVVLEGGDSFRHGRFVVPVLPLIYLGGFSGGAAMLDRFRIGQRQVQVAAVAASLALVASLLPAHRDSFAAFDRNTIQEQRELGIWLREQTPEDYKVAAFAIGALGYYSERYVLDMLGLTDEVIAHTEVPGVGTGLAGHERYNVDYVLEQRPEIIVIGGAAPAAMLEGEVRRSVSGRSPVAARDRLFADPRLWERYDVVPVRIETRWYNLLVRADVAPLVRERATSAHSERAQELFRNARQPRRVACAVDDLEVQVRAIGER